MKRYAVLIVLTAKDETPQNIANEIVCNIEFDNSTEVVALVVLDEEANEQYIHRKEKL